VVGRWRRVVVVVVVRSVRRGMGRQGLSRPLRGERRERGRSRGKEGGNEKVVVRGKVSYYY